MKYIIGPVALLSVLLLNACSAGGSSALPAASTVAPSATPLSTATAVAPSATATVTPQATPSVAPTATAPATLIITATPTPAVTVSAAAAGYALVTVTVPHRGPDSSGASITALSTIVVQLNSLNGSTLVPSGTNTTTAYTVPNQRDCSAPTGCSFSINAPSGTLSITATAYAASHPVATTTQTVSSTGNSGQNYSFALGGIVQSLNISKLPDLTTGTSAKLPLSLTISDPSGALILDSPLANPISLSDNDTSASSGLEIVGSDSGPQANVTITTPATSVLFDYNGGTLKLPSVNGQPQLFTYATSNYSIAPL